MVFPSLMEIPSHPHLQSINTKRKEVLTLLNILNINSLEEREYLKYGRLRFVYKYGYIHVTSVSGREISFLGAKRRKSHSLKKRHNIIRGIASQRAQKFRPPFTYLRCLNDYFEGNRWHVKRT